LRLTAERDDGDFTGMILPDAIAATKKMEGTLPTLGNARGQ
jgi:hypothetical protein